MAHRLLVLANLLIPAAVLLFATGFFPYKPFIPGLATFEDLGRDFHNGTPPRQFDRLVFMVVDALRSDFVFSSASGFGFTQKLIRTGHAIPFTAHAAPPTVTMPRVKAITTGSVPSFVDLILNFAESDTTSTLASQDTWLAQIKAGREGRGDGKLVFYGDDTWLKLFPNTFARSDGTSSFFVSDFTEVDLNVTRHVDRELGKKDWDAWIMHYLGLDHIGHKAGPMSPNMTPKHMEMDAVVQRIYNAMLQQSHLNNTLLVLVGDHGMNEAGNHGGSGPGETSTALVFISPKLKALSNGRKCPVTPKGAYEFYKTVEQSDLAPTISGLLGNPIPLNNLGIFIPEFLGLWQSSQDRTQILLRNALQILHIVRAKFSSVDFDTLDDTTGCDEPASDAHSLACKWKFANQELQEFVRSNGENHSPTLNSLFEFCRDAQSVMSSAASNYDVSRLLAGIGLSSLAFLLSVASLLQLQTLRNIDSLVFLVATALYGVMMFASSYVEEEQHFWYWISSGWLVYLRARSFQSESKSPKAFGRLSGLSTLLLLAVHRTVRRWNQTGNKHAGGPDIVKSILFIHPTWLWTIVGASYVLVSMRAGITVGRALSIGWVLGAALAVAISLASLAFKLGFTAADAPELFFWMDGETVEQMQQFDTMPIVRGVFAGLGLLFTALLVGVLRAPKSLVSRRDFLAAAHSLFTLLLITQSRAHNIPLFGLFLIQYLCLSNMSITPAQAAITSILLGHSSFFALGNSNAISSIDLSNAYNGVSGYNIAMVGVLLFLGNWAGPIWWALGALSLSAESQWQKERPPQNKKVEKAKRAWVEREHEHLAAQAKPTAILATSAKEQGGSDIFGAHFTLSTLFVTGSLVATMVACTVLRTHLFIWTVFSPKYLYSMAWSLGFHFAVTLGLGGGLWKLASRHQ